MNEQSVESLTSMLGENKEKLLADIDRRIRISVERLGAECFSVIEKTPGGNLKYDPPGLNWGKRLVAFCRRKTVDGHELDSPATDVIVKEVSAAFLTYYEGESERISHVVTRDLARNERFIDAIVDTIAESNVFRSSGSVTKFVIKQQVRTVIVAALQSAQVQAVAGQVTSIAVGVVSKVATSSVGAILLKQLLLHSQVIIAKILASAAFKTMLVAAIKKFAAAAILATLAHALWGLLGAKVAAAVGSAFVPVIAVGILGWVVYEIAHMPKKLADKLAVEVTNKLRGELTAINRHIAYNIYEEIGSSIGGFAAGLVTNDDFVQAVNANLKHAS